MNHLSENTIDNLAQGHPRERAKKNFDLWSKNGKQLSDIHLLERAFKLAPTEEYFEPYFQYLSQKQDFAGIQNALRDVIATYASEKNIEKLCHFVKIHLQFSLGKSLRLQDPAITYMVDNTLSSLRKPHENTKKDGKIKVGYVIAMDHDPQSSLPALFPDIALRHDKDKYEVRVYSELPDDILKQRNPKHWNTVQALKENDIEYICPDTQIQSLDAAKLIQDNMTDWGANICAVQMQMGASYFLTALKPAPVSISFDCGHPEWYTSPFADYSFDIHKHLAMESHSKAVYKKLYNFHGLGTSQEKQKDDPELAPYKDKKILLSCGYAPKYQSMDFWKIAYGVLSNYKKIEWLFFGITQKDVQPILKEFPVDIKARMHFMGVRKDFEKFYAVTDLYVDTYPVAGGGGMLSALLQDIPVATYRHNYNHAFDKTKSYSNFVERITDQSLISKHDPASYLKHITQLLENPDTAKKNTINILQSINFDELEPEHYIDWLENKYGSLLGTIHAQ